QVGGGPPPDGDRTWDVRVGPGELEHGGPGAQAGCRRGARWEHDVRASGAPPLAEDGRPQTPSRDLERRSGVVEVQRAPGEVAQGEQVVDHHAGSMTATPTDA